MPGVGAFPDSLSQPAVSARLGDVDTKLQLVLDKLASTENLEATVAGLARTVTSLQEQLRAQQHDELRRKEQEEEDAAAAGNWSQQERGAASRVARRPEPQPTPTYADRVRGQVQGQAVRGRSASTKRGRADSELGEQALKILRLGGGRSRWDQQGQQGRDQTTSALSQSLADARNESTVRSEVQDRQETAFTEVRRRRKQGVLQKGSSTIEAAGCSRATFSVFLSGTSPDCTEDTVREKLTLCAAALGGQDLEGVALEILKIEHIRLKIPHGEVPRSRCWKVTVPPQFSEHMVKSSAYPSAWGWRKWNRGPQSQASSASQGTQGSEARNGRA